MKKPWSAIADLRFSGRGKLRRLGRRLRRGVSLMEVLISTFVMAIGLVGLAALLPVGRFAIMETGKADGAGACGRSALRDVKIRRMLDYTLWDAQPLDDTRGIVGLRPVVIDPLGLTAATPLPDDFPANPPASPPFEPIKRKNLKVSRHLGAKWDIDAAEDVFLWQDDKVFVLPEDMDSPPANAERPQPLDVDGDNVPDVQGHYSWFLTVVPVMTEKSLPYSRKRLFRVSAVVCYRRDLMDEGEHHSDATITGGYGGGSVVLDSQIEGIKEGEWILLYRNGESSFGPPEPPDKDNPLRVFPQCHWYRVVAVAQDDENDKTRLSLVGPDWNTNTTGGSTKATAIVIDSVVGVYTALIELDQPDSIWNK